MKHDSGPTSTKIPICAKVHQLLVPSNVRCPGPRSFASPIPCGADSIVPSPPTLPRTRTPVRRTHLVDAPHDPIHNLSPERPIHNRRVRHLELCTSLDDFAPPRIEDREHGDDVAQLARAGTFDGLVEEVLEVGGEEGSKVGGVEREGLGERFLWRARVSVVLEEGGRRRAAPSSA